jgi:hypothetical protein
VVAVRLLFALWGFFIGGNMNKCKDCGSENVIFDDISEAKWKHLFCQDCKALRIFEKRCEHDYVLVERTILDGKRKLSKFCKKCYKVEDGGKLKDAPKIRPKVSYERWEAFITKLYTDIMPGKIQYEHQLIKVLQDKYGIDDKHQMQSIYHQQREDAYNDYLNSQEWKDKRAAAKKRDNNECQICGQTNDLCVHHLTYTHVEYDPEKKRVEGREFLFELVTLCNECHISHYHPHKL